MSLEKWSNQVGQRVGFFRQAHEAATGSRGTVQQSPVCTSIRVARWMPRFMDAFVPSYVWLYASLIIGSFEVEI